MTIQVDFQLDCKGLSCPMPVVRTKKAIDQLEPGQVLEVQATDLGSLADIQGWAKSTGHHYLGTEFEDEVMKHYLRKASASESKKERAHSNVIQNEDFQKVLENGSDFVLLDVREPAEYAFDHIHGAISIPFGRLEDQLDDLKRDQVIYVICRTGKRSDQAAQLLTKYGFSNVINIIPGMSKWSVEKTV
ncbi:sulfurtransferase TusA family protein [Risungbinella massiliensis]|uniref:sulfurtransferase TusA family protein n=1 Tax=Risungbinella massiliensis TaxID=1329796 RepID=UPI0009E55977|nr:sulfurtransferase TusA family protein [Risungbinella massiliensis]